jgi:putative FmdB family regulatory protein
MPLYEYVCNHCQVEFEVLVRGAEIPTCPKCGAVDLARQMSAPAAHVASLEGSCPVRETGACGGGGCSAGSCGMGQWG